MKDRIFFSGLNELRGIAAISVVIHHIELFKFIEGKMYSLTISFTILISYLSFEYFESYFLKLKDKFVLVPSGKKTEDV